jgi:hypothetical protein
MAANHDCERRIAKICGIRIERKKGTIMAKQLAENLRAPDFELVDTQGRTVHLSEHLNKAPVVLVLLRGFM